VGFALTGWYKNKQPIPLTSAVVVVTRNSPYTMNGGGVVNGANAVSNIPGVVGGARFGIDVTYTNKLTNPQGGGWVNFTIDGVQYQVKTNSLINFSVDPQLNFPRTSKFSSKVTITNTATGLNDGNNTMDWVVVDGGPNGGIDYIAITINGKNGGVVYSNNWNRATGKTDNEALASGNVVVNNR
jgi:hypothetical protein